MDGVKATTCLVSSDNQGSNQRLHAGLEVLVRGPCQRSAATPCGTKNHHTQHFGVSMAGANSVVEFEADISDSKQETIIRRLHRDGLISEVVPRHE
jgi:hypothetical protein